MKELDYVLTPGRYVGLPDEEDDFDFQVAPLFQKIRQNSEQIMTFEKLRDTLLPKLMSGQVRVKV